MLPSDMNLSPSAIRELENRLAELAEMTLRLQDELAGSHGEMDAIETVLACAGQQVQGRTNGTKPKKPSFAASIRSALADFGGIASPREVAGALRATGKWADNGKLVTKVNAELYRMSKSASIPVIRRGNGKYSIRKEVKQDAK